MRLEATQALLKPIKDLGILKISRTLMTLI